MFNKFLSEETRLFALKSLIRSNFSFCPIVWHFCSKINTEKLEKKQCRGLKIVFDCYESSYEELLTSANLPTLHLGRLRTIIMETFNCSYIHQRLSLSKTVFKLFQV